MPIRRTNLGVHLLDGMALKSAVLGAVPLARASFPEKNTRNNLGCTPARNVGQAPVGQSMSSSATRFFNR